VKKTRKNSEVSIGNGEKIILTVYVSEMLSTGFDTVHRAVLNFQPGEKVTFITSDSVIRGMLIDSQIGTSEKSSAGEPT
jgi:hypothetical protein